MGSIVNTSPRHNVLDIQHRNMGRGGDEGANDLVPVTLLCGFLGSGKTTLLKHILEAKHGEEDFNCAVIVNDMAELNIDKSLIDQTSLIQSDDAMVGMQNGCICCTLQSDLCDQIVKLTQMKKFNYILIEASGVSEPHEIAPLFDIDAECDESGDHTGHDHKLKLGEVARLDTCVTLIDSAEFYNNLGSMKTYDQVLLGDNIFGTITELMMDQVEFANIIILNKGDLVNEEQKADLETKIALLNPHAKILKSIQCKINVLDILNTGLYKDKEEFFVTSTKTTEYVENERKRLEAMGERVPEACTARFDIKSFVYRARKPFHPGRLTDLVLEPFIMSPFVNICQDEDCKNGVERTGEEQDQFEEQKLIELQKVQEEASEKQKKRTQVMGELLRSKGFLWLATANDVTGCWQQAGNVVRIEQENPWLCLISEMWEGTPAEAEIVKDMTRPDGEEWEYKDRRQEIVFIGHALKIAAIQDIFEQCLLTEEEMALGPDQWVETMHHLDKIKLGFRKEEQEEEEGTAEAVAAMGAV